MNRIARWLKELGPVFGSVLGSLCYWAAHVPVPASVLFHLCENRLLGPHEELSKDLKDRISVEP